MELTRDGARRPGQVEVEGSLLQAASGEIHLSLGFLLETAQLGTDATKSSIRCELWLPRMHRCTACRDSHALPLPTPPGSPASSLLCRPQFHCRLEG